MELEDWQSPIAKSFSCRLFVGTVKRALGNSTSLQKYEGEKGVDRAEGLREGFRQMSAR